MSEQDRWRVITPVGMMNGRYGPPSGEPMFPEWLRRLIIPVATILAEFGFIAGLCWLIAATTARTFGDVFWPGGLSITVFVIIVTSLFWLRRSL